MFKEIKKNLLTKYYRKMERIMGKQRKLWGKIEKILFKIESV